MSIIALSLIWAKNETLFQIFLNACVSDIVNIDLL